MNKPFLNPSSKTLLNDASQFDEDKNEWIKAACCVSVARPPFAARITARPSTGCENSKYNELS
jgi:hypothetical protein